MGIYFKGDPSYRDETYKVFSSIESNPVGHVIVASIRQSGKDLTFEPYTEGDCNAVTTGLDPKAGSPKGVGGGADSKAPWFIGRGDIPATRGQDERSDTRKERATGGGSDVRIRFSPGTWGTGPQSCFGGNYGSRADEVLLHEMVHASRYMHGRVNPIPTEDNSLFGYNNEEEFLAVVTANVYISSKGGTQLRAHQTGHTALNAPFNTSVGFLSDPMNRKIMNIHRLTWTSEFLGLSRVVSAKFNPFRELTIQLRNFPVGNMFERSLTEAFMPAR
jgi:hypothetical protein